MYIYVDIYLYICIYIYAIKIIFCNKCNKYIIKNLIKYNFRNLEITIMLRNVKTKAHRIFWYLEQK